MFKKYTQGFTVIVCVMFCLFKWTWFTVFPVSSACAHLSRLQMNCYYMYILYDVEMESNTVSYNCLLISSLTCYSIHHHHHHHYWLVPSSGSVGWFFQWRSGRPKFNLKSFYKISREKFEPEPGFEPRTRIAQVVERRARNTEVRGSNPGSGSNVSLEIL